MLKSLSLHLLFLLSIIVMGCKDDDTSPTIESVSPLTGRAGTKVTIIGSNFNTDISSNAVRFGAANGTITAVTPTKIIVTVPLDGENGKVSVTTPSGTVIGPDFTFMTSAYIQTSDAVTDLTEAILKGVINQTGSATVTQYGFIYSTTEVMSVTSGTKAVVTQPAANGNVELKVTGLLQGQKYYTKMFLATSDTIFFGNTVTFTTADFNKWTKIMTVPMITLPEFIGTGMVANGKGYLTGGISGNEQIGSKIPLNEFDPAAHVWNKLSYCPATYRYFYTHFSVGDTIYLGWGITAAGEKKRDIWKYNVKSKVWTQGADFPFEGTTGQHAFTINGEGYLVGKPKPPETGPTFAPTGFWKYSAANGKWIEKTFPPEYTVAEYAFSANNKGYIFGIGPNSKYLVWEYNPADNTWTKKSETPARFTSFNNQAFCVSMKDKAYVITSSTLWQYDTTNDTWKDLGALPIQATGGVSINDRLYIIDRTNLFMNIPR